MQVLLNIPDNCFIDVESPSFAYKERKKIEKEYGLSSADTVEVVNIGPGADVLVILSTIATAGLAVWNFPTVLRDGIENWRWLIDKLKVFKKKKQLVSLDQDAAGLLAIDYLAEKYGVDAISDLKDAHTFNIIDVSGMFPGEENSLAARPHNYYVFTFYVAPMIVVLSVRSTGEIKILEIFDDMPYGLHDSEYK